MRYELTEDYAGNGHQVAIMFGQASTGMIGPDQHAHHAFNGAQYAHEHLGGDVPHVHTVTVEHDATTGQTRPVGLSLDETSLAERVARRLLHERHPPWRFDLPDGEALRAVWPHGSRENPEEIAPLVEFRAEMVRSETEAVAKVLRLAAEERVVESETSGGDGGGG